jgi:hypothetical protein
MQEPWRCNLLTGRLYISRRLTITFVLLALVGTAGFFFGVFGPDPLRTWQAYLVNFLFWTGLSFGAVLFVAVLNMCGATWGRPLKRLAESFAAYLPVGFVLFWVLYFGRAELFPWIRDPVPDKQVWLNVPFLFARNGVGLLLLSITSLAMVYFSLKGDQEFVENPRNPPFEKGGIGSERAELTPCSVTWKRQCILSPILGILYAFVLTLTGFDLVMSLDRQWYSTLLGGYFLVGCFYSAIAALYLLTLILARTDSLKEHLIPRHFHDLGKLLLAFCLFTGYLFYAQFLTIWYGNMPEETRYVILRVKFTPWEPLAWVVLFMIFLLPFFVLLGRRVKLKRVAMMLLSLIVIVGMWLERFILVAPSLWKKGAIPLGLTEMLVTAGFFGVVGLCVTGFLKRVPILPVSDPLFRKSMKIREEGLRP